MFSYALFSIFSHLFLVPVFYFPACFFFFFFWGGGGGTGIRGFIAPFILFIGYLISITDLYNDFKMI